MKKTKRPDPVPVKVAPIKVAPAPVKTTPIVKVVEEFDPSDTLLQHLSTLHTRGKEFSQSGAHLELVDLHDAIGTLNESKPLTRLDSSEIKSFINHGMGQVLQFMGMGILLSPSRKRPLDEDNLLSQTVHQILLFIQKFVLRWNIDVTEVLNRFHDFIRVLQTAEGLNFDPGLNLTFWRDREKTECIRDNDDPSVVTLGYETFSKLRYSTTPQNLAEILVNSTPEGIILRGKAGTEAVSAQGLVYCEVELDENQASRGGSTLVRFNLPDITKKVEGITNYFELAGRDKFSQMVLISHRVENEWWLLEGGNTTTNPSPGGDPSPPKRSKTIETPRIRRVPPIQDIREFEWDLDHCGCEKCDPVRPEFVIEGELKLEMVNFKVIFDYDHNCGSCAECEMRRECQYGDYDEPVVIFAESVPPQERGKVIRLQEEFKIFDVEQFDIMRHYWEEVV
ncbi:hypothetical protein Fcan01_10205 [Folsomia candida]|uniref:Uncharacterized protein n=2 Tax=Folsomia candida TaxID=158441 RepID=A0A226EBE1_FOLCA|nr:hypothetical protein Fcan01_10205 [Folsomia candida]